MKIKTYSWILAGVYELCGIWISFCTAKAQQLFSGYNIELPFTLKMAFAVGPFGWFFLSVAAGLSIILKDLRFDSRLLNPMFTFGLLLWVASMMFALLSSLYRGTYSIH